ncbi:MAG: DUF5662 family protein [Desulfobacteraceae bacterium]
MLNNIKKHGNYLKHILRHKYYVALECFKQGLVWRGITHDWSKLLPSEWFAYADYFYGERDETAFDSAWEHHKKFNDHHWEHWTIPQDSSGSLRSLATLPMSYPAIVEMLCDWMAMERQNNKNATWEDVHKWYCEHSAKMRFHLETLIYTRVILNRMRRHEK